MVNSSKNSFLICTHTTRKQGIKSLHSNPSHYPESMANPTYKPTSTHLQNGDNFLHTHRGIILTFAFCDTLQCRLYSILSYIHCPKLDSIHASVLYDMGINCTPSTTSRLSFVDFHLPDMGINLFATFGGISWVHIICVI